MTPAARERAQVRLPMLLVSAAAWIVILLGGHGVATHVHDPAALPGPLLSPAALTMVLAHNPPAALAAGWALMLAAMMLPLLTTAVRHVRDRSFADRRARAIALFLIGYGAIWMATGALLLSLSIAAAMLAYASPAPPIVLAAIVTLAWECSPIKQRCRNRGHVHPPLAAAGLAADVDVLRFGLTHGLWCAGACWTLMLLPVMLPPVMLPHGHLAAMAAVSLWLAAERFESPAPARWRLRLPAKAARIAFAQLKMLVRRRPRFASRPDTTPDPA